MIQSKLHVLWQLTTSDQDAPPFDQFLIEFRAAQCGKNIIIFILPLPKQKKLFKNISVIFESSGK